VKRDWYSVTEKTSAHLGYRRRSLLWLASLLAVPKAIAQVTPHQSRTTSHAVCSRSPGLQNAISPGRREPSGIPDRVVVRHGLARRDDPPARVPGHVLLRTAGPEARQPERIHAAPDHDRARGTVRPRARQAHPRSARGARWLRSCRRRPGPDAGMDR